VVMTHRSEELAALYAEPSVADYQRFTLKRVEAAAQVAHFVRAAAHRGLRCVRIVHGKGLGSRNREPVLKGKLRAWLVPRDEVLAFCQAPPAEGGSGALLVLLKGR